MLNEDYRNIQLTDVYARWSQAHRLARQVYLVLLISPVVLLLRSLLRSPFKALLEIESGHRALAQR